MAGTTVTVKRMWSLLSNDPFKRMYETLNKVVTDLETLRVGIRFPVRYAHEQLAAGADIAARAVFQAPVAMTVLDSVKYVPQGNSAGIDAGNSLVVTLRNITEGVDVATITRTTDLTANTPIALTLTAANADIAANDVLGLVLTQGATADVDIGVLQFEMRPQTVDAAGDLVAFALSTIEAGD